MIVIHRPAEGDEERFDARKIKTSEAQIVSRTTDMSWAQVKAGLLDGDPEAMRAIAWVIKKRTEPTLRYGDFDPEVEELVSRFDAREVADFCEQISKAPGTEEEIDAAYDEAARHAADPEAAAEYIAKFREGGPKEPASSKSKTSKSGS
ncbi:hypothetical protein EAO71_20230 [Streptomyces sp. ms191]|uniref:hypothetical protein n=1 Tax=Streptomyces sp. ms191 TaxID=1827978 RepID=UPI0011CD8CBA|nr:hypothetical protein [Streptomyces sp. ms191]TXS30725.1 hypothetical protein EAO71_20230 [Streptomyces sp. ms191]